ncbi:MAG TPA: glycine cleavage system protein H [Anaerolineae bacterium]|nr:glycine cleavage system protein H [Anaerolineae bacterium]
MSQGYLETTVDKFIFRVKVDNLYNDNGIWADMNEASGIARLGLSDFTQQSSGDVAFVSLPDPGQSVVAGKELATVETIKVDLEVQAPFDGEIVAVNEALEDAPELINQDPYGRGWLVEIRPAQWPVVGLLDAEQYLEAMTAQAEAEAAK